MSKTCWTIYIRTFCGTFLFKPSLTDPSSHGRMYLHTKFHFHQSLGPNGIEYNAHHKNKSDLRQSIVAL